MDIGKEEEREKIYNNRGSFFRCINIARILKNNYPHLQAKLDAITRWSNAYDMCCRLLEIRSVLEEKVIPQGLLNHVQLLTKKEWEQVSDMVSVLKTMHNLSLLSQEEDLTCVKFMK